MNKQIIVAKLEQYRAVRDNAEDALKEYCSNMENTFEDRWSVFTKYNELTTGISPANRWGSSSTELQEGVMRNFANSI